MRVLFACVLLGCAAPASPPPPASPVAPAPSPEPTFSAVAPDAPIASEPPPSPELVAAGKEIFTSTCTPCHGADAQGVIGPNLTDSAWLHGSKLASVERSIRHGWPSKGMPAWGPQLGDAKIRAVAAFVVSIRNTNVPGGKPPQGVVEP